MRIEKIKQGEPVELTPDKKVGEALQLHLSGLNAPEVSWAADVKIDHLETNPRGDKLSKRYAHNEYKAAGSFSMCRKVAASGVMLRPLTKKFEIKFKDVLDDNGLPDLAVEHVSLV